MRLEPVSSHHKGQYRLVNDQGSSDEASLVLVVDGAMGSWTEFGACSKTCTQTNGTSGEEKKGVVAMFFSGSQERTRQCVPPVNGGLPCTGALVDSRPCGTQACPGAPSLTINIFPYSS